MNSSVSYLCLSVGLLLAVTSPSAVAQATLPLEAGGSNYIFWSNGDSIDPNDPNWYSSNGVKPVIGTYHLNPSGIQSQLAQMYSAGQRKLALVLWYAPLGASTAPDYVYGHVVDSSLGQLQPIHQQNLRSLLSDIAAAGFTEVYFRFAPYFSSNPRYWSAWNEPSYQQSWSFISSTISIIASSLANSNVRIAYDLSLELGGVTLGQAQAFEKRLWHDYCNVFDSSKTYGFSISYQPNRLTQMIDDLRTTGKIPSFFAVDIYEGTDVPSLQDALGSVALELQWAGLSAAPVILEEAWTGEHDMLAAANSARSAGLNLVTLMEWPLTYATYYYVDHSAAVTPPGYAVDYSADWTSSMGIPDVLTTGYGCSDLNCLLIYGVDFDTDSSVNLYDSNHNLIANYSTCCVWHVPSGQQQALGFQVVAPQWNAASLMAAGGGFYVQVSQPSGSSPEVFMPTPKPAIASYGLGCSNNQCIWMLGNNFGSDCGVKIYPGNWSTGSNPIANIVPGNYGLTCSNTRVTTQIPPNIVKAYRQINVLVYNTVTGLWSQPVFLNIP
jgi:hypothetical protein